MYIKKLPIPITPRRLRRHLRGDDDKHVRLRDELQDYGAVCLFVH